MKKLLFLLIIILFVMSVYYLNLPPSGMEQHDITIEQGDGVRTIAYRLEHATLIKTSALFLTFYFVTGKPNVRAGTYRLYKEMSTHQILEMLTGGNALSARITIPEGFNLSQIAERLQSHGITQSASFLMFCNDQLYLHTLGIHSVSAEGYLFPDTYFFPPNSDPKLVIKVLHERMNHELTRLGVTKTNRGNLSIHQILTLASLIEEEAKMDHERVLISSVFHNRLKRGMKLDCDPTVRYAKKKFTGPITYRDLEYESPYNTYRIHGLPPTPICSPGRDSIRAALNPKDTDLLFFVAKNDGSHYFSKTLKEHLKAVNRYRKGIE